MGRSFSTSIAKEKALLVGLEIRSAIDNWSLQSSMQELSSLVLSAGLQVVGKLTQKLIRPSSTIYLGKGKLQELKELRAKHPYDVAVFNDELTPRQQRNLEEYLESKIIDRTALILDIFAQRARTSEGKLQVELAQYQYILPRLAGQWSHLERLGGGIGTRGPGESQLETDRRLIRQKIKRLEVKIESIRQHRALYREYRRSNNIPVVALVGYTNAGKSTLLNALSKSSVMVADRLFSTLDPVTRRITLGDKIEFLLTDTVGFIHKLPPSIVAAFRATLEELREADVLLHVIDITHQDAAEQYETVERILQNLQIKDKYKINVLNKIDLMQNAYDIWQGFIKKLHHNEEVKIVPVSALKNTGLDILIEEIEVFINKNRKGQCYGTTWQN